MHGQTAGRAGKATDALRCEDESDFLFDLVVVPIRRVTRDQLPDKAREEELRADDHGRERNVEERRRRD